MEGNKTIQKADSSHTSPKKTGQKWVCSTSEKSILCAEHLASNFTPNSDNNNGDDIVAYLNAPCQLSSPVRAFTPVEIKNE
jgi:hypothetical protein